MKIGHSDSMCLTDRIFLETHVTFCEYSVFHEFNSVVIGHSRSMWVNRTSKQYVFKTLTNACHILWMFSVPWINSAVVGHSSSMCLTDRLFLQTHVTFCEYLVFHKFNSVVIGHLCSMCLADRTFLQTHVTFLEYLVFHKFNSVVIGHSDSMCLTNRLFLQTHILWIFSVPRI